MPTQPRVTTGRGRPQSNNAREIDRHRPEIEEMWKQGATLRTIMDTMMKYGIEKSKPVYKRKFKRWNLRRNRRELEPEDSPASFSGQTDNNLAEYSPMSGLGFISTVGLQMSGSAMFNNNPDVAISRAMETPISIADEDSEPPVSPHNSLCQLCDVPVRNLEDSDATHSRLADECNDEQVLGRAGMEDIFEPGSHDVDEDWYVIDSAKDPFLDSEQFKANIDALDKAFHCASIPAWLNGDADLFPMVPKVSLCLPPRHFPRDVMSINSTATGRHIEHARSPSLDDPSIDDLSDWEPVDVDANSLFANEVFREDSDLSSSERWDLIKTWLFTGTVDGVEKVVQLALRDFPNDITALMPYLEPSQQSRLVQYLDDHSLRSYVSSILERPGPFTPEHFAPFEQDIFQESKATWANAASALAAFNPSFLRFMCDDPISKWKLTRATEVPISAIDEHLHTDPSFVIENTRDPDTLFLDEFHPLLSTVQGDEICAIWNGRLSTSGKREKLGGPLHQVLHTTTPPHRDLSIETLRLNFMAEFQHIAPLAQRYGFMLDTGGSPQSPGLAAWEAALNCLRLLGADYSKITPTHVLSYLSLARAVLRTGQNHGQNVARDLFTKDLRHWVHVVRHYQEVTDNAPAGTTRSFCSLIWRAWHIVVDDAKSSGSTFNYCGMMREMAVAADKFLKISLDNLEIAQPTLQRQACNGAPSTQHTPWQDDPTETLPGHLHHEQQDAWLCGVNTFRLPIEQAASALGFILGLGLLFFYVINNPPNHPLRLSAVLGVHQLGIACAFEPCVVAPVGETLLESTTSPKPQVWKPNLTTQPQQQVSMSSGQWDEFTRFLNS